MKKILSMMCVSALSISGMAHQTWTDIDYVGDGLEGHRMDIHLPHNSNEPDKVVVLIYGSAWFSNRDKQAAFEALGKPLLDAGFAVVSINHRSSVEAKFPAQINDVKAAVRFLRGNAARYNLDTSFIGITGYSSGGHLSALCGATNGVGSHTIGDVTVDIEGSLGGFTSESSDVDAVVDWFGPVDMARMEECRTYKDANSPEAVLIGGNPADNRDMIDLLSPLAYLDAGDPKFLVIHGMADSVVPDCQSVSFCEALRKLGLLQDFIRVENGEHGPVTFNEDTFARMVVFFETQAKLKQQ